jgi:hypothetical protein
MNRPSAARVFLTSLANFLVMLMVVAVLLFTIYLARCWRQARREMHLRVQKAENKTVELKKTVEKQDFIIKQLRKRLRELQRGKP